MITSATLTLTPVGPPNLYQVRINASVALGGGFGTPGLVGAVYKVAPGGVAVGLSAGLTLNPLGGGNYEHNGSTVTVLPGECAYAVVTAQCTYSENETTAPVPK